MSSLAQIDITYTVVGILVGFASWLATENRNVGILILTLAVSLAGAFGVEVLLARLFGIYATFGSLDTLIATSIVKAAAGAILTVALMRLGMHFVRPRRAGG